MLRSVLLAAVLGLGSMAWGAASSDNTWSCDGANIEGAGISEKDGKLVGAVSWDCFPGGGICTQQTDVTLDAPTEVGGATIYKGSYFTLVLETDAASGKDGEVKGHLSATDMTDASDQGRGLTFSADVTCKH